MEEKGGEIGKGEYMLKNAEQKKKRECGRRKGEIGEIEKKQLKGRKRVKGWLIERCEEMLKEEI